MTDTPSTLPVVLVDGSSYVFRAYHALPPLTNRAGHPTGAIKGVISMIRALQRQYPQSPVIVVFDAPGPTFRNDLYDQYKANRPPMPEDLRPQLEPIHDIVRAMGLPLIMESGVEADDVIGTLAQQAVTAGYQCVISTGDKDLAQLVTEHITLINTMSQEKLDPAGVINKFGFGPDKVIDYLALMGDKTDNIPGVPGIGEKTAKALLADIGGMDALYKRLDEIPHLAIRGAKTLPQKLLEHEKLARLSYQLATIRCDVPLTFQWDDLTPNPANTPRLREFYQAFEFNAWLQELEGAAPATTANAIASSASAFTATALNNTPAPSAPVQRQTLDSPQQWQQWLTQQPISQPFALWPVFAQGHYRNTVWLGLAVASGANCVVMLDFRHSDWPQEQPLAPLIEFFTTHRYHKVAHDLKRLLHALCAVGITPSHVQDDVMILSYVRDATLQRASDLDAHFEVLGLDNLMRQYLAEGPPTLIDVAGKFGVQQKPLAELPSSDLAQYAQDRAVMAHRLYAHLAAELQQQFPELWRVYEHIERPLIPVLQQIEWTGTRVDAERLAELSASFRAQLTELEQHAFTLAGRSFNLDSPKQLGLLLFEELGLPIVAKTPSGQPSTNEEVLTELSHHYELPKIVLQYRHLRKLLNTYTDPLPLLIHPETQRVHTSYHQAGAQTGRLSSSEPNLQNIPIRSEAGRSIRSAFVARPGYIVLAADYSQIELRIMTHLSEDTALVNAFQEGRDIHRATAAEIMGIAETEVTDTQRRDAKAVNFGLIYGMSAFGLARNLGISRPAAQQYVDRYFERYPGVKAYMSRTRAQAHAQGYVETLLGRRLYLPELKTGRPQQKRAAERTAINAPMQGTAADIIKQAMTDVQLWLQQSRLDAQLIMQVHDELVLEVHPADLAVVKAGVELRMRNAAALSVPLVVDMGVGAHWGEAH